jgi:group I intron endonuclease
MVGIYKITNPNGKIYIGQSTNIQKRFYRYKRLECKGQIKLYNSLKKYGWDAHKTEIIEECEVNDLLHRETFWKNFYNVLNDDSLCCRIDGRSGKMSQNSVDKLSTSMKEYWDNLDMDKKKLRINKQNEILKLKITIDKIKRKTKGVPKSEKHIENLKKSQNKEETVNKRKKSLRKYWDEMDPILREKIRQKNIETQNREDVKKKISENNASKRPEVKIKQIEAALKRKKIECPHCHQFHDPGNSKKYHFDNCKLTFR